MDLAFGCNEKVKFSVSGNGSVHLSGYFIPTENENGFENGLKNGQTEGKEKKRARRATNLPSDVESTDNLKLKKLEHGVEIENLIIGEGEEVKDGDMIWFSYVTSVNGNMIGESKDGVSMIVGSEDVIAGWNIGVIGMKPGSKRRIIPPPNAAYGKTGFPPIIPPNATVISEIQLLRIENQQIK